jgi:selenocysteine lyase/cysteine desulfurase
VDYALALGVDAIEARIGALAELLRAELSALPGVAVHDPGARRCGIVTFTRAGVPAPEIVSRLRAQGINISASTAAWARLDLPHRGLEAVGRASVHAYNSEDEVGRFVEAVRGCRGGSIFQSAEP